MAAGTRPFAIRTLSTTADMRACEAVQKRVWGYADLDVVPKNELTAVARSGGVVLGAFDSASDDAALVGFCFGFVGLDLGPPRRFYLCSRMLAVDEKWRGTGLAFALKQAQREAALVRGLDSMRWTFDPFAAANAVFNLRKLGAVATGYARDYYGETTSPLHAGGTDRLLVEWALDPRTAAGAGSEMAAVDVPLDIEDAGRARVARTRVAAAFEEAFARGFRAAGVDVVREEPILRYQLVR